MTDIRDFQLLFESTPDLYLVLSPDLRIVAANDARLRATNTTRDQIIGKPLFEVFPDNPDDPAATGVNNLRASLHRVQDTKAPDAMAVQKYDIPRPASEGGGFEERYWSPLNTPVLNRDGEIEFIIHRVEDVTAFIRLKQQGAEQSRLTEELKVRAEQMESEIYQRAQQLQRTNEKLREAERTKSEFFANVSHELRTPLSLILAPTESLLGGKHGELSLSQYGVLRTVQNNTVRLHQMVTGLLDFSKAEAGRMKVRPEPVDVVALTRSITHDFAPTLKQRRIGFSFDCDRETSVVLLDQYLFERILFNLLSNAVKFTEPGGKIGVRLAVSNDRLLLAVADTGIGIAEKDIAVIFQKFRQVEGSSTRRFEGTGLGLAMVKEFAELMGGTVTVSSEPGKGSEFVVEFPAAAAAVAGQESAALSKVRENDMSTGAASVRQDPQLYSDAKTAGDNRRMKVLVCEDNEELAMYIATLLQAFSLVNIAGNGLEGLELVKSWSPDLVITDVMMPGLDGIGLCTAIKSNPQTAGIPVVMLTAQTHREAMLKGWEAKADEYLFKPFHPDELITRIRAMLTTISERRAYAELVAKQNAELERARVEMEQKGKLEEYAHALERSNRELEEIAYISAHDMKSPIASLQGLLTLMEQKGAVKESHLALFEMIKKSTRQMQRTILALNDAIAFKKTLTIQREKLRFDDILNEVRVDLLDTILSSKAVIRADFSQYPEIFFPRVHLKSILQNLLTNSIKYAKPDQPPVVDITTTGAGNFVILELKDQGIGIDLSINREKVFHMFQRFHTHKEGLGLGLYLVHSIVDAYKGRITVESEVNKGTVFKIYLQTDADVQEDPTGRR
ncbi:MAG: response regulator [Bacteroidetes bacterium]|nr:response regulator [Bacteroidota bacterium]